MPSPRSFVRCSLFRHLNYTVLAILPQQIPIDDFFAQNCCFPHCPSNTTHRSLKVFFLLFWFHGASLLVMGDGDSAHASHMHCEHTIISNLLVFAYIYVHTVHFILESGKMHLCSENCDIQRCIISLLIWIKMTYVYIHTKSEWILNFPRLI